MTSESAGPPDAGAPPDLQVKDDSFRKQFARAPAKEPAPKPSQGGGDDAKVKRGGEDDDVTKPGGDDVTKPGGDVTGTAGRERRGVGFADKEHPGKSTLDPISKS